MKILAASDWLLAAGEGYGEILPQIWEVKEKKQTKKIKTNEENQTKNNMKEKVRRRSHRKKWMRYSSKYARVFLE